MFISRSGYASTAENPLMQKGWAALVKDNENEAFQYFWQAHEEAKLAKNTADSAESLLYLGICSYGASLEKGLQFVTQSLNEYRILEKTNPEKALIGRYKCLQLISTIYVRQKKCDEAMSLSTEVVSALKDKNDTSGTLGLAYNSLGLLHKLRNEKAAAEHYYTLALREFEIGTNTAYLPTSYRQLGEIALAKNQKESSLNYFNKSLALAESTENKQAKVNALIAIGKWYLTFENKLLEAENYYSKARAIARLLSDKSFKIKTI